MPELRRIETVRTVAVVGAGLIGAGWAVQFLMAGFRVVACDSATGWSDRLRATIGNALSNLEVDDQRQIQLFERLEFADNCEDAVASADFVQESGPEDVATKRSLIEEIASITPDDVVISSSTSGLLMSDLQQDCRAPSRLIVGHPFNPVYLMPLVEVVAGQQTSAEAVDWLSAFYESIGKKPVVCEAETTGFIANRLQEALFRESLHMVDAGEATAEQIDDVMRFGPGLRWAFMGPFLTYHMAGGRGGMRKFFESFGDTLTLPYSRLEAPLLSNGLVDTVIRQCDDAYRLYSSDELENWRDRNIGTLTRELRSLEDLSAS